MSKKKSYQKRVTKKKWYDVFNGHVSSPGEFIFIYVMIGVICIGAIIMLSVFLAPKVPENLTYETLLFERYEALDKELHLYTESDLQYFSIPAYQKLLPDSDAFLALISSGTQLVVGYEVYDKADIPHYGIESIKDTNGIVFLSMDEVHEYRWGEARIAQIIFGVLSVIWIIFVALSIYVGRNPDKFSRKTIRLFFRDGYCHRTIKR